MPMEAFVCGYKHKCLEGSLILCKFDNKFSPRVIILSVTFFFPPMESTVPGMNSLLQNWSQTQSQSFWLFFYSFTTTTTCRLPLEFNLLLRVWLMGILYVNFLFVTLLKAWISSKSFLLNIFITYMYIYIHTQIYSINHLQMNTFISFPIVSLLFLFSSYYSSYI